MDAKNGGKNEGPRRLFCNMIICLNNESVDNLRSQMVSGGEGSTRLRHSPFPSTRSSLL